MSSQYRLVELGNTELLAGLSELVQQSNVLTARVVAHLVELEKRLLHLELGFSSLFAYCVEALGMSEGSAGGESRLCGCVGDSPKHSSGSHEVNCICAHCARLRRTWIRKTRLSFSRRVEGRLGDRSRSCLRRAFRAQTSASRSVVYPYVPRG